MGWRHFMLSGLARLIHRAYPNVSVMDADTLHPLLSNNPEQLLLLDVRSLEEFTVSHIPHAVHCSNIQCLQASLASHSNCTVVVYCSLGYRSALLADAIKNPRVLNLHGGIFDWVLSHRLLNSPLGHTTQVHGYGVPWCFLLPKALRR